MIPIPDVKQYCIEAFKLIDEIGPILDIFYILLKDQGLSYQSFRIKWRQASERQLKLFREG